MNLQGIFDGLLTFFEVAPNGTEAQFINALKANELATQEEAELFLLHFLDIGEDIGLLATADFAVMMAKRRDVGLERASNGARAIYDRLIELAAFRVALLQERLVLITALLEDYEAKLPMVATSRVWIENNSPASQAVTDATLEALDLGVLRFEALVAQLTRQVGYLTEQIEGLGG